MKERTGSAVDSNADTISPVWRTVWKGLAFMIVLCTTTVCAWILLFPSCFMLPFPSKRMISLRRRYVSLISGIYFDFAAAMLTTLCGTKLFLYCDTPEEILSDKGVILISNHRTRVDWMYCGWCYAAITNLNADLRVILKDSLRSVPFFGWCMQMLLYIFLTRKNKDGDISHITRTLNYLSLTSNTPPSILIFPEGTDLSPSNVVKSHNFAKSKSLPELSFVLYPKSGGLAACLSVLNRESVLHDITIAYKDYIPGKRTNSDSVLLGQFPREIHLCIKRHVISELPSDRPSIEQWLRNSFSFKEGLLAAFYKNNSAVPPRDQQGNFVWPRQMKVKQERVRPALYALSWIVGISSCLYVFRWFRWLCSFMLILSVAAGALSGFDMVELALHGDASHSTNKKDL